MKVCFLICLMALVSCSHPSARTAAGEELEELPVVEIGSPPSNLPPLFLSEIADSIHYVALETSKNCLLSNTAHGYSIKQGFLFIQGIGLLFSPEGKFLNSVGRIGKGPEEFLPLNGNTVDEHNGIVYFRDYGHPNTYVKYSLEGKFIGKLSKSYFGNGFRGVMIDSAIIISNEVMDKRFVTVPDIAVYNPVIDSITTSRTIDYGIKRTGKTSYQINPNLCLSVHPKFAYYKSVYCDTMYMITKNRIVPAMILDFGRYTYSKDNYYGGKDIKDMTRRTVLLHGMRRIENRFFFLCVYKNNDLQATSFMYACDTDGKNGKYYQPVVTNDLDNGPNYYLSNRFASIFVADIDDKNRSFYFPKNKTPKKMKVTDHFAELYGKAHEEDNPILQVIHFKDDD